MSGRDNFKNKSELAISLCSQKISCSYFIDGKLCWFSCLSLRENCRYQYPSDWNEHVQIWKHLVKKSDTIIIDKRRPYSFLLCIYQNFKQDSSKIVFINPETVNYLYPIDTQNNIKFVDEWLVCHALSPLIREKFLAYPEKYECSRNIFTWLSWKNSIFSK